ncbi:MAG: translation initiation factor IF-2 N-terminal domain-containing protein, partial [Clostridia bacterium]|nr:translation initiation factor IF-2 N-terminal domain-containing protein [Clostridia bacterium]
MATEQKYRVNDFAKDFGIPSKEIMTMLAEHEMAPKTHMAALDTVVSNFILEYYTQKHMADQATFAAYMTATAPEKKEEVPAAAKPAPAAAKPAPAAAKPAPAAAKPAPAAAKPAPAAAKPAP